MAQLSSIVIAGQSYKYLHWLAYKSTINQQKSENWTLLVQLLTSVKSF